MNYNTLISSIPVPDYKEQLVKKYQNTHDIITDLIYCFKTYNFQASATKKLIRTGNTKDDSRQIYDFIQNNIEYKAEPFTKQTTSSFSRVIFNKIGDCKHSFIIVGCIGWNLGYNVIIRFVSYDKDRSIGHVYTILQDPKTKQEIIVDPLQQFNYEKPYTRKKDYIAINKTPNNMALSRLTGTGESIHKGQISIYDPTTQKTIVMTPFVSSEKIGQIEQLEGINNGELQRAINNCRSKIGAIVRSPGLTDANQKIIYGLADKIMMDIKQVGAKPAIPPIVDQRTAELVKRAKAANIVLGVIEAKKYFTQTAADIAAMTAAAKASNTPKNIVQNTVKDVVKAVTTPIVKTVALAPIRAAFDILLFFNAKNLAGDLSKANQIDPNSIKSLATKFGYDYNDFTKKIAAGAQKKSIGDMGIGVAVPATVITALTIASPMVLATIPLVASIIKKKPTAADNATLAQAKADIQTIPDISAPTTNKYLKPALITLGVGTAIFFGGKQMGWFGKK